MGNGLKRLVQVRIKLRIGTLQVERPFFNIKLTLRMVSFP